MKDTNLKLILKNCTPISQCIQGYRQRYCKDDLKHFKYDDSKVKLSLLCLEVGNHKYKCCTVVSEVSSFVGDPV